LARDGEVTRVDLERERGQIPKAWEALDGVPNRRSKNRIASESEHDVNRIARRRRGRRLWPRVKRTDVGVYKNIVFFFRL